MQFIAIEMRGVARYFSKVSGSGVDVALLKGARSFMGDRFLSSAGAGGTCARPMRLPDPSPVLKKIVQPWVQKIYPELGLGSVRMLLRPFLDSSSVLDRFQSWSFNAQIAILLAIFGIARAQSPDFFHNKGSRFRNRSSNLPWLAISHRTLKSECGIALSCLQDITAISGVHDCNRNRKLQESRVVVGRRKTINKEHIKEFGGRHWSEVSRGRFGGRIPDTRNVPT